MLKRINSKFLSACALVAVAASNALATDPTSLAEVGSSITTEITDNKGMLFGIMGAVMAIGVALMIFRRARATAK